MPAKKTKNIRNAKNPPLRSDNEKHYEEWKSKLKRLIEWDRDKTFYTPVRESIESKRITAPGYFDLIKNPMDFKTVESKIDNRIYQDQNDLYNDLKLIYDNAILYNEEGTDIHMKAVLLFEKIKSQFTKGNAISTETAIDTPENVSNELVLQNDTNTDNHNIVVQEPEKYKIFKEIYEKTAHWKRNIFSIPSGKIGKEFITEMTRLIDLWCNKDSQARYALYGVMILPKIILQKHMRNPNAKSIKEIMSRRLKLWKEDNFLELFTEGTTIQSRLKESKIDSNEEGMLISFRHLMSIGKVNAAMKVLENSNGSGILPIDNDTIKMLDEKHPNAEGLKQEMILQGPVKHVDPIIYEELTPDLIKKTAFHLNGSAGPSNLDSDQWRSILGSSKYGQTGLDLAYPISRMAKILCIEHINDSDSLDPVMACRLIPLNKNPGLRPIGIGECLRRIIGKAVTYVLKRDIQEQAGSLQLCSGVKSGIEANIHAMRDIYEDDNTHGLIQIDARNAFNFLNRKNMTQNLKILCPELATYCLNCYTNDARLFVTGGLEILSREGVTQGDPISMALYALGILPLLSLIKKGCEEPNIRHAAYADDISGAGKLKDLKTWWDNVTEYGPKLGYYPEPSKSWLIVKSEYHKQAENIFADTGIQITMDGRKHLGAAIGTEEFKNAYVAGKIEEWKKLLITLSKIAKTEPHMAYSLFVHGFRHKFTYIMRTIPHTEHLFKPIDKLIDDEFIPALFNGRKLTSQERELIALPTRLGGLGIIIPSAHCNFQFENSCAVTKQLQERIMTQKEMLEINMAEVTKIISEIKSTKDERHINQALDIYSKLDETKRRLVSCTSEKGASSWLNALPLKSKDFHLSKSEFWDAINMRYGFQIKRLPSTCACGKDFSIEHALSCLKGGYVNQRHNTIRNLFAELLSEISTDVQIEPQLSELTGENLKYKTSNKQNEARLDISARNVWRSGDKAFFDVRVFNPTSKFYRKMPLKSAYISNEKEKKREYNERIINVEHGSLTPLVFSCYGGMSQECGAFFKHLTAMISDKRDDQYQDVCKLLRTKISFSLLRISLICLRGYRGKPNKKDSFSDEDTRITNKDARIQE